ncbi:MAG: hypothetical protein NTX76_00125 [Alphaproteobacteria bacterium]|nr:hypothetical protein [Alphaproteobacteria bacterium]
MLKTLSLIIFVLAGTLTQSHSREPVDPLAYCSKCNEKHCKTDSDTALKCNECPSFKSPNIGKCRDSYCSGCKEKSKKNCSKKEDAFACYKLCKNGPDDSATKSCLAPHCGKCREPDYCDGTKKTEHCFSEACEYFNGHDNTKKCRTAWNKNKKQAEEQVDDDTETSTPDHPKQESDASVD